MNDFGAFSSRAGRTITALIRFRKRRPTSEPKLLAAIHVSARGMIRGIGTVLVLACGLSVSASGADYYKVQVTRKSQDFYEVNGQGIYIKTRFCYEYVYFSDAVVKLDGMYGYTIGEIIFVNDGGGKCDIEKVLK